MRKSILGLIGLFIGGYIGFLNRPSVFLVGQLPFRKVIFAGANLKGMDKVFVQVAQTSFNYMLLGALAGLAAGLILAWVIGKK